MAETLTVAFRVAEEAIDEAISNAEFDAATQVTVAPHSYFMLSLLCGSNFKHATVCTLKFYCC